MTDHLEVGRVAKSHGLRGEVLVALTTNRVERVAPGAQLYLGDSCLEVVSSKPHQGKWIVQFAGVVGREAADEMHGKTLTAPALDDPDELWVHELIGAEVFEVDGTARGTVQAVQENPASDLLVLDDGMLVPLVFVVEHVGERVVIDPPDGLFDVQS